METQDWKWFTIGSLFSVELSKGEIKADNIESGTVPLVSSGGTNNGIVCYVDEKGDGRAELFDGNKLTVDMFGHCFYHATPFYSVSHGRVNVLTSARLNRDNGLFVAAIIEREIYRYSYGRAVYSATLSNATIKLPAKKNGNGEFEPDWQWMEDYMRGTIVPKLPQKAREVFLHQFSSEPVSDNRLTLDVAGWQQFKYEELFDIKKGKRLTKADMEEGDIPFVGATDSNNGITARIANCEHLHPANTISVSYNGSIAEAYYQAKSFWASDDVNVLYPKFALNEYIALFLTTIINKEKYRFNYGRKWDKELMKNTTIKLPAKRSAAGKLEPDWQWMENYIKGLPFSGCLR